MTGRLILIEPNLKDQQGHYAIYVAALAKAWPKPDAVIVLAHLDAKSEDGPAGARLIPALPGIEPVAARSKVPLLFERALRYLTREFGIRIAYRRSVRIWPGEAWLSNRLQWVAVKLQQDLERQSARVFIQPSHLAVDALTHVLSEELNALRVGADDLIVIPSCSRREVLAVRQLLDRRQGLAAADWALIYRSPLELIFDSADARAPRRDQPGLLALKDLVANHNHVRLFADNASLAAHLARRVGAPVVTLPIPHAGSAAVDPVGGPGRAPVIGYLGEARVEKGFLQLPTLVRSLKDRGVEAEYQIQCTFNLPGGEPGCAEAVDRLAQIGPGVNLIIEAPSPPDYDALLGGVDLLLAPYARDRYRYRTSGIVCEALARGVPVIVPSGAWLEGEFASATRAWMKDSFAALRPLAPSQSTDMIVDGEAGTQSVIQALPPRSGPAIARFHFDAQQRGAFTLTFEAVDLWGFALCRRDYVSDPDALAAPVEAVGGSEVLFTIPKGAKALRTTVRNSHGSDSIQVRLDLTVADDPAGSPVSAVGYAYGNLGELADAVEEVLLHLSHYRKTARDHAAIYAERHRAETVLSCIQAAFSP